MRFHSTAARQIAFDLLGHRHTMQPGDEIEVPDEHAYLVASRRLPLAAGKSPAESAGRARSVRLATQPPRPAPRPLAPRDELPEDDGAVDDGSDAGDVDAQLDVAAASVGRPSAKARAPRTPKP